MLLWLLWFLASWEVQCTTKRDQLSPGDIVVDSQHNPLLVIVHPFGIGCHVYLGHMKHNTPAPWVLCSLEYVIIFGTTIPPLLMKVALVTLANSLAKAGIDSSL